MYLKITNGSIEINNKVILEDINFLIKNNEKVGLVGRNGSGKTTLLKGITGQLPFTDGYDKLNIEKDKFKIGYVSQENLTDPDTLLIDYIRSSYKEIINIEKNLESLEKEMSNSYKEETLIKYNDLLESYEFLGGYTYKKEYITALNKFGFNTDVYNKKISEFSGGELTKLSLLKLLLSRPDLLILDEPTNHLDITAIEWLENYLKEYKNNIILVSHDRMFLDSICNIIYLIEYGTTKKYVGNYTSYIKQREEEYIKALKDYNRQKKEIKRLEELVDRFRYKPTKAKMAMSKLKQIEKMVKIEKPETFDKKTFKINFNPTTTSYKDVLKLKNLSVGYTKELFNIDLNLEREDKLGIIGDNGIGKSTLIKTITGVIPPIKGKVILGQNVKYAYFSQQLENLNKENTIYDEIKNTFNEMTPLEVRTLLGSFNFKGDDVFKQIKDLSGGEKVRVSLCKILNSKPNLLILDEPTNHLDLINKETIESLLTDYKGTLIIVSHDRYLINKVCTKLLVIEKNKTTLYNYGYKEYLEKRVVSDNPKVNKEEKTKKEKKNIDKTNGKKIIEKEINDLEKKVNLLNNELLKSEVYMDQLKSKDILLQIESLNKLIDKKYIDLENIEDCGN
jgi:ATP-binding cassette subfamily F protein 3